MKVDYSFYHGTCGGTLSREEFERRSLPECRYIERLLRDGLIVPIDYDSFGRAVSALVDVEASYDEWLKRGVVQSETVGSYSRTFSPAFKEKVVHDFPTRKEKRLEVLRDYYVLAIGVE